MSPVWSATIEKKLKVDLSSYKNCFSFWRVSIHDNIHKSRFLSHKRMKHLAFRSYSNSDASRTLLLSWIPKLQRADSFRLPSRWNNVTLFFFLGCSESLYHFWYPHSVQTSVRRKSLVGSRYASNLDLSFRSQVGECHSLVLFFSVAPNPFIISDVLTQCRRFWYPQWSEIGMTPIRVVFVQWVTEVLSFFVPY